MVYHHCIVLHLVTVKQNGVFLFCFLALNWTGRFIHVQRFQIGYFTQEYYRRTFFFLVPQRTFQWTVL